MAKVECAVEIVAVRLFGASRSEVRILDAMYDHQRQVITFSIEGDDVPDAARVSADCVLRQTWDGARFVEMSFAPL